MFYYSNFEKFTLPYIHISYIVCQVSICLCFKLEKSSPPYIHISYIVCRVVICYTIKILTIYTSICLDKLHCLPSKKMFYVQNFEKSTPTYVYISNIDCRVVICFTIQI